MAISGPTSGPQIHHEIVADRGEALRRGDALPHAPARDGHVHLGVPLHSPGSTLVGLRRRLVNQRRREELAKEQCEKHDHQDSAQRLGERELPAQKYNHDDEELEHEVGRRELECHRCGEVRTLPKYGSCDRDRGVGTR